MVSQLYQLEQLHCAGTPEQMGAAQGEELREAIRRFVEQRFAALEVYMSERQRLDVAGFLEAGRECLEFARSWDPLGTREFLAMASAAHQDPVRLYAAGNMTDVRDLVLLPTAAASSRSDEGCSALLLPPALSADQTLYAAQTWDLNPSDLDFVVAVHRKPAQGPETWSITCTGCLSLMGMNQTGLAVGTTNIKARDTRPGVGYLSLIHRALAAEHREEARAAIASAPRAAAHTYWLADAAGAVELECGAHRMTERTLRDAALTRTNHCLAADLRALEGEAPSESSQRRLERLNTWLGTGNQSLTTLRQLFSDRADGLFSINRYREDDTGTSTNACLVAVPARRELWVCRGPADRGVWQELRFET